MSYLSFPAREVAENRALRRDLEEARRENLALRQLLAAARASLQRQYETTHPTERN
ncbi:hypothetical protein SCMU_18270 [Sinomonas cyclohexanicum]|uniref:Transposase n=1 Tax=Sinomonas cyclohexanicum TaxID=322009 RepID=A0ABM7PUZ9_SINCY|nr:hypothetical protein [Corynebacterium cyclohexanicum]BCT75985.1 hypothetical protein SCMU_18270 [Corynebacterium cyclohexanicum]